MAKSDKTKLLYSYIISEALRCIERFELKYSSNDDNDYIYKIEQTCQSFVHLFIYFENASTFYYEDYRVLVLQFFKDDTLREKLLSNVTTDVLSKNQRNKLYKYIFTLFNDELDMVIVDNLDTIQNRFADNPFGYKQTFLSYSYADKGLTLILFFYFLVNNGYLYVDWMHSPAYPNGIAIKDSLTTALDMSSHLLFLYTPNSEVESGDKRSLKEWCSWEFGSFYSRSHQSKFYIRLPNNFRKYKMPDILDTFMEMDGVVNGVINGHYRNIQSFYVPRGEEAINVTLNLLTNYVSDYYSTFEPIYYRNDIGYDAYSHKYKIALEVGMIVDSVKGIIDDKYIFKTKDAYINEVPKNFYMRLRSFLYRKLEQLDRFNIKVELALLLPTRFSTSLSIEEEKELLDLLNNYHLKNVKKVYLLFIDSIHRFVLGDKPRINKFYYYEKDI